MGVSANTRLPHWSGSRGRRGGRADGTAAAWRTDGVLLVSPAAERGQDGISIGDRRCSHAGRRETLQATCKSLFNLKNDHKIQNFKNFGFCDHFSQISDFLKFLGSKKKNLKNPR